MNQPIEMLDRDENQDPNEMHGQRNIMNVRNLIWSCDWEFGIEIWSGEFVEPS